MSFLQKLIRKYSIRSIIIIFILVFTIVAALLLMNVSEHLITSFVIDKYVNDYVNTVYSNFNNNINTMISQLNMLRLNITIWEDLYFNMLDANLSNDLKQQNIQKNLGLLLKDYTLVDGVDIITADGTFRYSKTPLYFDPPPSIIPKITRASLTFHTTPLTSEGSNYIAVGAKYYNFFNNYDLGYIILYFNEEKLYSTYQSSIPENSTFFVTSDDYIISHPDKSELGAKSYIPRELYSEEKLSMKRYESKIIGKYTISNDINSTICLNAIISAENLYHITYRINNAIYIMLALMLSAAIIVAFLFTRKLLLQYNKLSENIEQFGNDPSSDIAFKTSNELSALETSFTKMTGHINRLMREKDAANERQRTAELKALQVHINPHFIYNALDVITCMAKFRGDKDIEKATYALASFFRIGLSEGAFQIKIADEVKHVQSYAAIEAIRFPDLFEIEYDINEVIAENFLILKITLQPLVENCIKHGFNEIEYKGKIQVRARFDNNDIVIDVIDNGIGLNASEPTSGNKYSFGYGLKNIQQRLSLEYGKEYGVSLSENKDGGTTATVRIPKIPIDNSYNNFFNY